MRLRGGAGASAIDGLSKITLLTAPADNIRLSWSATSELTGPLSKGGAGLIGGVAHKLMDSSGPTLPGVLPKSRRLDS
jgi:carbon monoxide dehydrogenase subunit G